MPPARLLSFFAATVLLLVVGLYTPTLRGGFVYDSIAQVLHSEYLHTPANWTKVLTLQVVAHDELDRNRPLHLASLMADAALWGKSPFGYRLTSVLLHAGNAALLFAVGAVCLGAWSGARRPPAPAKSGASDGKMELFAAAFGTLVFALHPLVVEAVAEPSNREDLLVLFPTLLGVFLLVRAGVQAPPRWWPLNLALVACAFLAVTAKESGVATPFVFLAAAWLFMPQRFRQCLPGVLLGAASVGAFLAASYVLRPVDSAVFAHDPGGLGPGFWASLMLQVRIWALQIFQIFWPTHLSAHYLPQVLAGFSAPVALGVLVAAGAAVWALARTSRLALLGAVIFVLTLLPASNFAAQFHPVADRYLYAPLAGFGLIGSVLAFTLVTRFRGASAAAAVVAVALLAAEYAVNFQRQLVWQTPKSLWTDVLVKFPGVSVAHLGLANDSYRAGQFEQARVSAAEAVVLSRGQWDEALAFRAICEWQSGHRAEAVETFRALLRLSPRFRDIDRLAQTLFWSPEQLEVMREVAAAARS
jgi:protein O-mannosyl-transferase